MLRHMDKAIMATCTSDAPDLPEDEDLKMQMIQ